jgi:uncharacterized membrane protein YcaP (DUF421 family)
MWEPLFSFEVSPLNLFIRGVVVYLFVLFLLRISGKREMGQMSAIEFVAILLLSNAVQNSMNAGDNSLIGGLLLAITLVGLSTLISYLTFKSRKMSRLIEGSPTLLVYKGKVVKKNLAHERLTESELKRLLRRQDIHDINEVKCGVLEPDGARSITKHKEAPLENTDAEDRAEDHAEDHLEERE